MCRTTIGVNHGHSLTVPMADVMAGAERSYDIGMSGTPAHTHLVTVNAGAFAQLRGGTPVTLTSTEAGGGPHSHPITITCA